MKTTEKQLKMTRKHKPIWFFVISLAISGMVLPTNAQPGTVQSHQKISSTQGNFTGVLDNSDLLGWCALASIGDLDGDGNNDIVVGAPFDDDGGGDRGALWIMFLNSDGTVKSHQKISATQGGFTGNLSNADMFGHSVTSLGDLDGDGVTDIAAGAIGDDDGVSQEGAVWILFLNTDGTVKSHQKISAAQGNFTGVLDIADWFGYSIASLEDLDGDGVTDIAVGARFDSDSGSSRGAVWMLFLNTDGTVKSHQKISSAQGNFTGTLDDADYFGWSVTSLDDLDGDGITDIAVGATFDDDGNNNTGAVWILFLNADGTVKSHQKISAAQGNFGGSLDSYDLFGGALTSLGDLDGDGITDIAVSAYQDDDGGGTSFNKGAVWILFLNADGTVKSHQKISQTQGNFTGTVDDADGFGTSLARIADLNGDSIVEIAVGTYQDDDGGNNRGAIWMLFLDGTPSPLSSSSINLSFTETDVSCSGGNDGVIAASVSGGTPPYNYIWSDGQNTPTIIGLNAGTYFVMVIDATGATVSGNATITQPPGIYLYINSTQASCGTADGTASVIALGGAVGFSYLWNDPAAQTTPTATGLAAGTYLITVTDANFCFKTDSVRVDNPYAMNANIAFIADADCNGGCEGFASVIASGGIEPYFYQWSDPQNQASVTATGLCAGEYTVTVSDFYGCSATSSFTISEPEAIDFSTAVSNATSGNCDGTATVMVSGGTPGYFYLWDDPDDQITQTATDLCSGIYNVTVWDANGCSATQSITIEEANYTGVEDNVMSGIISIYPNPTAGKFTIETRSQVSQDIEINITNPIGQEIYSEKLVEQFGNIRKEFDFEDYPNGVYMINILNEPAYLPTGQAGRTGRREFLLSKRITIIN